MRNAHGRPRLVNTTTPVPCGIPYIYGILKQVEKNIIPDENFIKQGIRMHTLAVKTIDRENKTANLDDSTRSLTTK